MLVSGKTDFSFVSDHATITMAMAVGVFVANRKFGVVAIGLALLESLTAKMRLFRVPEFLGMAFLLSLLALTSDSLLRG